MIRHLEIDALKPCAVVRRAQFDAWTGLLCLAVSLVACRNEGARSSPHLAGPAASAPSGSAASAEPRQHRVVADGHPISVWEKTPAASARLVEVFVLVHGRTWSSLPDFDLQVPGEHRSLMDALVTAGYGAYGIDLRGYGATPRDQSGWLNPQRAAADLGAVVRWVVARHGKPVVLLGWSLGAMVAQLYAQQPTPKLRALVLYGYPAEPGAKVSVDEQPAQPPVVRNTRQGALADFITPGIITEQAQEAFAQAALEADPVLVMWRRYHEFNVLDPAKINVPTLVIHGEYDPYAPVKNQRKLVEGIGHQNKQWIVIPGADHAAHLEDTQPQFVAALTEFLERLAAGQPVATPESWPSGSEAAGGAPPG